MDFDLPIFLCAKDDFSTYIPFLLIAGSLVIVTVVGIVIVVTITKRIKERERERTEDWKLEAEKMSFSFTEENHAVQESLNHFKLFNLGHTRILKNVLVGEANGTQLIIGDYRYTTGSGKDSQTHQLTFCTTSQDSLGVPHFFLRKQSSFFDYLGKMFGGQDIDFEEDPEFSDSFVLQGDNPESVVKLFDQRIRNFFVENKTKSWQVEARGPAIIVHNGLRVEPNETREVLEMTFAVIDILKETEAPS